MYINSYQRFIISETLGMHDVPGSKAWIGLIRTSQLALTIPGPISRPLTIWVNILNDNFDLYIIKRTILVGHTR